MLKFSSAGLPSDACGGERAGGSFVSGIIAAAFETKEDGAGGSRRLSLFGKAVLSCVIPGSPISAVTQLLEDRLKRIGDARAKPERAQDVSRIAYIIDGTERIAHRIEPIEWNVQVRYRIDDKSGLLPYVGRIRSHDKGVVQFDMVGEFIPDRNDPHEAKAWNLLMKAPVYVGILKPEIFSGDARNMAVPLVHGVSVLFDASRHADPSGMWKPGPTATLPAFYSRMRFSERDGQAWLVQEFVVRNSPEATTVSGAISPLDLAGYDVVAESDQRATHLSTT